MMEQRPPLQWPSGPPPRFTAKITRADLGAYGETREYGESPFLSSIKRRFPRLHDCRVELAASDSSTHYDTLWISVMDGPHTYRFYPHAMLSCLRWHLEWRSGRKVVPWRFRFDLDRGEGK